MLKQYKEVQPHAYHLLKNTLQMNKPSHAYLFEVNGYDDYYNFVKTFVKELLILNIESQEECNLICEKVDNNVFSEFKVISADGLWIKKEQIDELQKEFKNKSLESQRKVYIIRDAEKLNNSSANSLLKFLEEPSENIVAILLTNNSYQLLPTIKSRCQIVKLRRTSFDLIDELLDDDNVEENLEKAISFIEYYEKNKKRTLLYIKSKWHNFFSDKDKLLLGFKLMILIYKDLLNFKLNHQLLYPQYSHIIAELSNLSTTHQILNKINTLVELEKQIKYNVNSFLLMDKLIIEFGKIDIE